MTTLHNPRLSYMSKLYAPTLREDPSDADIASARLLVRAGYVRKEAQGLYSFLPLGMRVLHKIERIIREEMDASGAQEILMPFLQRSELWQHSGRWEAYGPELLRVHDRHNNEFCLSPTHEELITELISNELRSYKDLPKNLYQIQIKFRDEIRPRFGLLRGREFIMKDAYSFNASQESLDETYNDMREVYSRIFDRMEMNYRIVQADPGQIGGNATEEFMTLAQTGEAELVYCSCGYAADTEVGEASPKPSCYKAEALELIETPGVHTIAELAQFFECPESSCAKAFAGKNDAGEIWIVFVPGNYEVNECKVARALGGFCPLTEEEMLDAGLPKGSMGPANVPQGVHIAADRSLREIEAWIVGANKDGYHMIGAKEGRDFTVERWDDFSLVQEGDACPCCGRSLEIARGIEVAQIFKLGTKYSETMEAYFMNEEGKSVPFIMGCYGIGVSRTLAAMVEQNHDDYGLIWPAAIAPAHVCLIPLSVDDDEVYPVVEQIAEKLLGQGLELVIDDRSERPGVKFADGDLIGWPCQIVVGKRGLANGEVELKLRASNTKHTLSLSALYEIIEGLSAYKDPVETAHAFYKGIAQSC